MQLLKREIEAEITSLDNRKKLKKSGQNEKEKEKEKRREKRKKAPITQTKLNFKLCSVDYKVEKDFTRQGLDMIGKTLNLPFIYVFLIQCSQS